MVLWEITLGTAYFLGLKRTYKLALQLQRRLISPNHPKIQLFVHRRTRAVFDMAVKVHKKIQEKDLEVGRDLGNWILRRLDRMKPAAQIRTLPHGKLPSGGTTMNHVTNFVRRQPFCAIRNSKWRNSEYFKSNGRLFASSMNMRPKFPTFMRMLQPVYPTSIRTNYNVGRYEGVIRKDIMQWMVRS